MTKFNFIINFLLVISSIIAFIFILIVLPPKIKLFLSKDGYQIGIFEIEKKWSHSRKHGGFSSGLIGKINNQTKRITFNYQKGMGLNLGLKNFQIGSKQQAWYHKDIKTAFFKSKHSDKFEIPYLYMEQIYSSFVVCFIPFLILGFKYLLNTRTE